MSVTRDAVREVVENAILNQPRSLQKIIGPSEVGIECDRCLGHKLAGTPQKREAAWLPYVGTAMHSQLERVFLTESLNADVRGLRARWAAETRVWVGQIDGQDIHGSCDLFDAETGTTVDFKLVGKTTLTAARIGPSRQYRIQGHLYGRGWVINGADVNTVAICYLPRNAVSLDQGVWWEEPYDERVALDALDRADALAKAIRVVGAEQILPTLVRKPGCYDCGRYPAYPSDPPLPSRQQEPFADLIPA